MVIYVVQNSYWFSSPVNYEQCTLMPLFGGLSECSGMLQCVAHPLTAVHNHFKVCVEEQPCICTNHHLILFGWLLSWSSVVLLC